jgi:hypothetical protein
MNATAGNVTESLTEMCAKAGYPLTIPQRVLLLGALAVWLQKARQEGAEEVRDAIGGPVSGYLRRPPASSNVTKAPR